MDNLEKLNEDSLKSHNSEKIKLITDSDLYWDKYWSKIDNAQKFIFIITYDIDNKMIANLTVLKLIEAMERGVQVVLMFEHLNFYMKNSMFKQLKKNGAIIIKPNPLHEIFSHAFNFNIKKFFNRCHQKVTLIDKDLFIGSLNIADEYSGIKYGSNKFIDLNLYAKNTACFHKVLNFFKEFIDENKDQIKEEKRNQIENLFEKYLKDYKLHDSINLNDNIYEEFLEEKPPLKSEIQDNLYDLLDSSKESITIIQSYYTNIKRIEDILIRASKRGVKVKIITAASRDQVAYRYQYNNHLFKNLLSNGVEVREFLDKFFHMKAYYIDNKIISMGSLNNDITSFLLNNEANYLIKKNEKNNKFFKDFDCMVDNLQVNCRIVELNSYRNPIRFAFSKFWYLFIWCMEKTVANRKVRE